MFELNSSDALQGNVRERAMLEGMPPVALEGLLAALPQAADNRKTNSRLFTSMHGAAARRSLK